MALVLLVSKPLVPPWNDSSKNLARDVALGLSRHVPVVLGDGSGTFRPPRGRVEPLYRDAGRFAPGLRAQASVLRRLATGAPADLWHFFFAPNPKSSIAARALAMLRRQKTVQTVCSRPRNLERARSLLFADRTVVLSRSTLGLLLEAGVSAHRLVHIPPAVPALDLPEPALRREMRCAFGLPLDAPLLVYPGDLELGDGAARTIEAFARLDREIFLVMACRPKTRGAKEAEKALRARAATLGIEDRMAWIGETPRIHDLLACCDVVALPSTDLYAKMDLPLVLIEAMWLARPVVVASKTPAAELADDGAALAVDVDGLAEALSALFDDSSRRASLGERARDSAAERFSLPRMAQAYETLYDRLLEDT